MAKIVDVEGVRNTIVKSLYGRRLGLDQDENLIGPKGILSPIEGLASNTGETASTATAAVSNYGFTAIGTAAAGLTTGYTLAAPEPGIRKTLSAISTAYVAITCTTGSFIMTTANSTGQVLVFERGIAVDLIGLSTSLWHLVNNPISSLTTNATIT